MTRICLPRSTSPRRREVSSLAAGRTISINRAPVLTLWAAVVAERLGFDRDTALTLGRAVAGLNAYAKGVSLGLFEPSSKAVDEHLKKAKAGATLKVDLLHRAVPVVSTPDGLRALSKDRPISAASVERYLQGKFAENLEAVRRAMESSHAQAIPAAKAFRAVAIFLRELAKNAEQLTGLQRWRRILTRAFQVFLQGRQLRSPPRLAPG